MHSVRLLRAAAASGSGSGTAGSKASGGFGAMFRSILHKVEGKKLVGSDKAGNSYFIDAKHPSKRWVEYPNQDILGCSQTVPMPWHSWLRHGRDVPPTLSELDADEAARAAMASKVAALNAADAKLRMQEMAERHSGDMDGDLDLSNLLRERDQHGDVGSWSSGRDAKQ